MKLRVIQFYPFSIFSTKKATKIRFIKNQNFFLKWKNPTLMAIFRVWCPSKLLILQLPSIHSFKLEIVIMNVNHAIFIYTLRCNCTFRFLSLPNNASIKPSAITINGELSESCRVQSSSSTVPSNHSNYLERFFMSPVINNYQHVSES